MNLTGVALFDNIIQVFLSGALTWLIIVGVIRKLKMFQGHQYAQLIVSVLIMGSLMWMITTPDSFIAALKMVGDLFNKIKG